MNLIRLALRDLRRALRPVLLFALVWAVAQTVILSPFVSWALGYLLRRGGQPAISNQDIAGFLMSPAGVLFLLLTAVTSAALQLGQLSGYQLLAQSAQRRVRLGPIAALRRVMRKLPRLAGLAAAILVRVAVVLVPAAGLLALLYLRLPGGHDINYYLATEPPEWRRTRMLALLILVLAAVVVAYLLLRWMLALPHLVATGGGASVCLRRSWQQTAGRGFRLATPLLLWWATWALASVLFTAVVGAVVGALLDFNAGRLERTAVVLLLLETTALVVGTALNALGLAVSQFVVARTYHAVCGSPETAGDAPEDTLAETPLAWRRCLAGGLVVALLVSMVTTIRQLRLIDTDVTVHITAHRGSSRLAPENSLSAVRQAIADGADFAEIDVQSTRDGQVVLWHDGDLMRTIRDPRAIGDCTLADLQTLDVGSYFGPAFANERMATLEEAIASAGDRIRLNVELKYNRPDPELAARVAEVLRRKNFLHRCVVTSLDSAALQRFRELAGAVPVGLTVGASMGDVTRVPVDFLSVNSRVATPAFFNLARRHGKTLHIWTVNDREAALRFINLGADHLITDEPALLAELRRELRELDEVERLALALRQRLAW
ncbi:MAG: glycerophosphoryl diester phosphodiesterase membrane domain-containing protein [Verrucomicrobia bacterium]|nr:glycerophosphoryl diester phosphodiesterase membrane domain-containing protein [Verrucomicrobiota bacterium]